MANFIVDDETLQAEAEAIERARRREQDDAELPDDYKELIKNDKEDK